jgi:hypothetical protein
MADEQTAPCGDESSEHDGMPDSLGQIACEALWECGSEA